MRYTKVLTHHGIAIKYHRRGSRARGLVRRERTFWAIVPGHAPVCDARHLGLGRRREVDGNHSAASRLKLKSIQEMSLVDLDAALLQRRAIRTAPLHLRSAGNEPL